MIPQIPCLGLGLEHYYIGGWNVTTIIKLLMNYLGYFVNCVTLSPPENCDHSLIFARLNNSVLKLKCYNRRIRQFNHVNDVYEAVLCNELANFDLNAEVFSNSYDINDIYSCWFKQFHDIVKTKIPSRI